MNEILDTKATVGVFWAGALPFYSNNYAIDFLGKSDRLIAGLSPDITGAVSVNGMYSVPGHNKYDLNYSIGKLLPTYVQGFKWGQQDLLELKSKQYVEIEYKGVKLFLLRNSPQIKWEKLSMPE